MSHASAVLVPALLAVALADRREGAALIDAYLIGLQAQAWIGETVERSHYTTGWHGTPPPWDVSVQPQAWPG